MNAIIIKDACTKAITRVGQEVKILRSSLYGRVWIKTPEGEEISIRKTHLKIVS